MENNDIWREALKENLISLRKNKGLTQAELGEILNYSDKSVSKWERGDGVPDLSVIMKLSELYNVSPDKMLGQISKEEKPGQTARHTIILLTIASTVLACALITFLLLTLLNAGGGSINYLCFIFALTVILLAGGTCFVVWKKYIWAFGAMSVALWSVCVSIYLSVPGADPKTVFTIGGIIQATGCLVCSAIQLKKRK